MKTCSQNEQASPVVKHMLCDRGQEEDAERKTVRGRTGLLHEILPSAIERSSLVVVRSAETVMLVCLDSAVSSRRLAKAFGWCLALSPYVSHVFVAIMEILEVVCRRFLLGFLATWLWLVKRSWPGKTLVMGNQSATSYDHTSGTSTSHSFRNANNPCLPSYYM
jgi:hypothetical protein